MAQENKNGSASDSENQSSQQDITKRIDFEKSEAAETSSHRPLVGWIAKVVAIWAICAALFHIIVLRFIPMDPWIYRTCHLVSIGVLGFLLIPGWQKAREKVHWTDWIFVAGLLYSGWYIISNLKLLIFRVGVIPTTNDVIVAVIVVITVLELTRRASGNALPILCAVFIAYAFVGPYLPGVLHHSGYSFERFITYIFSLDGIFSVPLAISSKYIILFIIFSAFLQVSGVGRYFVKWAFSISGHLRGGPAKVAVLSSALMGTMNGTSAGNAVATGSFTIPLMRKVGYSPKFAASVEAVASTGGQIMPPIMGAGVFIMAELTGIPYNQLMLAGILPAVLYFASIYFMVDIEAIKLKLIGFPRHMLPPFGRVMREGYLFLPVLVLFTLLLTGYSVVMAGFWAIISSWLVSWVSRESRMGLSKTLKALEIGARGSIQLMAVCAAAGIIMGVIALTGIGLKFSTLILGIAGTSTLLALIFAMLIAIVLGMGMPTTAAYAVAASVVAPGLIRLGIDPLLAHFFVFYFACVSAITPPVALAAYAASGISGSDPMKTSMTSFRLGITAYIVPFMFFYGPEMLLQGDNLYAVIPIMFTALVGVYGLASAVQGWYFGKLSGITRVILFAASLNMVIPETYSDIGGLIVMVLLALWQKRRNAGKAQPADGTAVAAES